MLRRVLLRLGVERRICQKWAFSSFSLEICQSKPKKSKTTPKSDLSQPKNTIIMKVRVFPNPNIDKEEVRLIS